MSKLENINKLAAEKIWIRFSCSKHPLFKTSIALEKAYQTKDLVAMSSLLLKFVFLLWGEIHPSFGEHIISLSPSRPQSVVQAWFLLETNGQSDSFFSWFFYTINVSFCEYFQSLKNSSRISVRGFYSFLSKLSPLQSFALKIFIIATVTSTWEAFLLSYNSSVILSFRKTKANGYREQVVSLPVFSVLKTSIKTSPFLLKADFNKLFKSNVSSLLINDFLKVCQTQTLPLYNTLNLLHPFKSDLTRPLKHLRNVKKINCVNLLQLELQIISKLEIENQKFLKQLLIQSITPMNLESFLSFDFNFSEGEKLNLVLSPSSKEIISFPLQYSNNVFLLNKIWSKPILNKEELFQNKKISSKILSPARNLTDLTLVSFFDISNIKYPFILSSLHLTSTSFVFPFLTIFSTLFLWSVVKKANSIDELENISYEPTILHPRFNQSRLDQIIGIEILRPELLDLLKSLQFSKLETSLVLNSYLFIGPPGTGKTKLAQAIAGEAQVPFIGISASDILALGSSAPKAIRELFDLAKQCNPCIIFIDEIDSFGQARTSLINQENSRLNTELNPDQFHLKGREVARLQVLTEFLVQLDGLGKRSKIIVLGATNSLNLDPALTRPGRFNKNLSLGLPSFDLRKRILQFHAQSIGWDPLISWDALSRLTDKLSGAHLQTIVNESLLKVVQLNQPHHTLETFELGINRVLNVSSLFSQASLSMFAKYQNPFLFLSLSYYQTAKLLINLLYEDSSVAKLELIPPYAILASDLSFEQIMERSKQSSVLLNSHQARISSLLAVSISDYFIFSRISSVPVTKMFSWLSLSSLKDFHEVNLILGAMIKKWSIFSSTSFASSLESYLPLPKDTSIKGPTGLISGLETEFPHVESFLFNTSLQNWRDFSIENWQPFENSRTRKKLNPDIYVSYSQNKHLMSRDLKIQETLSHSFLIKSQSLAFLTLAENLVVFHCLAELLVQRKLLRLAELEFILKNFYYYYISE